MASELLDRFFRMETTFQENAEVGVIAREFLLRQRQTMADQERWLREVDHPASSIFRKLSMAYDISPETVKCVISKEVAELRTAATEQSDRKAQLILLEVRGKFETANIHPPSSFPYLDWVAQKK